METYVISLAGSLLICINGVDIKFKEGEQKGYCGMVDIWECEFIDNEVNDRCSNDRQLKLLSVIKCQMKIMNSTDQACMKQMVSIDNVDTLQIGLFLV